MLFILRASAQGDNMFNLFGPTSFAGNASVYMLIAAAVMIPTVWLPDVSSLSFLGAAGVTATCTVLCAVRHPGGSNGPCVTRRGTCGE